MYFEELEGLKSEFSAEKINKLDNYLAILPKSRRNKILPHNLEDIHIEYELAQVLLDRCSQIGLLKENYQIRCPKCNMALKIFDKNNFIESIEETNYCYACDSDIIVNSDDIYLIYELIKRPKDNTRV